MAFTAAEVTNITNAALNWNEEKGTALEQSIQKRPLLARLESKAKTFPGGKSDISLAVQGDYGDGSGNDVLKGYTHNDVVSFMTPANIKRVNIPWRETHIGLTFTYTEAKIDGISITSEDGDSMSKHSQRDLTVLVNLIENKIEDLNESYARSLNKMFYGDGTADPKGFAGLKSLVRDNPAAGTVGGLDSVANKWWRNRARTAAYQTAATATPALAGHGGDAVTSNVADGGALLQVLQFEQRQLVRYGGKPDFAVCGSAFLDAMEKEIRANGTYSVTGFTSDQDGAMGSMKFAGTTFTYDPTMDD